ncbi:MAG TPA: hypothetical protein DEH78_24975 [Solibacterales bacterium]|nr:hypothetical protein [Bryobacterales bacterium]
MYRLWMCAVLWAALAQPLRAGEFDAVRDLIRGEIQSGAVPSLSVAVARGGFVVWEEAFGWADRDGKRPATPRTMYSLASISKPFTATALMTLVEAGKVKLDAPVNDYLDVPLRARIGDAREATLRRVANHTSGLPLHYQFFYADGPWTRPPMAETIRRFGNLIAAPGEIYEYSNLGYGVLDYVVERVSGKPYQRYLRENVLDPLGMKDSAVVVPPGPQGDFAARYETDGRATPFYDFDHRGGSAVYASVHDLIRFALFHLKQRQPGQEPILSAASIDEMQRPTAPGGYAIGWRNAGGMVSHTGGMGGVSTVLAFVPEKKLAVAVLTNSRSDLPGRVLNAILNRPSPARPASPPGRLFRPAPQLLGEWHGAVETYREKIPLRLVIDRSGAVTAWLAGQPPSRLTNVSFENGRLVGSGKGDIGIEEANRRPYFLLYSLTARGSRLTGGVSAISMPGPRVGNALTQWVDLARSEP